jgi:hypothetical protein
MKTLLNTLQAIHHGLIHVVVHGISKVGEVCVKFSLKTLLHGLKIVVDILSIASKWLVNLVCICSSEWSLTAA